MHTTLKKICQEAGPTLDVEALRQLIDPKLGDNDPFSPVRLLDLLGFYQAIWSLRTIPDCPTVRLFAADCAERALPVFEKMHPGDKRARHAIETARRYALGQAPYSEMEYAHSMANSAAIHSRSMTSKHGRDNAPYAAALAATHAASNDPAFCNEVITNAAHAIAAASNLTFAQSFAIYQDECKEQEALFRKHFTP